MHSVWSSCFEVKISPKEKCSVGEDNYSFIIAPFHKAPVISFENVKVGCKKVKTLTVINGTRSSIEVQLSKCPPQFTFSLLEFTLPASGRTEVEISWTPLESGSWRDVVKVQTNTILKYDMSIICSSKDLKVLPKKAIKKPKSIAGPALYLGNRCANGINIGFGNSIENTKLITGLNSNTCKLLKNDHESSASVYNSSTSRRETMVLSKSKFSCNKENEREKQFQNIASSKMTNIDEIYDKKKLTFENVPSFTSICDNLELSSEANDQKIYNINNWNLSNKSEAIFYPQNNIDEHNNCFKNVEAEYKILNSNEKHFRGDINLSFESDKFYDSLEDSKNSPNAEGRIFGTSLPPVKEFTSKGLPDMDVSLDFLRLVQSPTCMKNKFIEMSNTNFSFDSETKTDRLCNFTPNWLQTPKCVKYLPDSDTTNHAGGNFLNRFCLGDSPLEDTLHKRENRFEFRYHCSTPKPIKNPDTDLTEINNGKMSVNFEEDSGETSMDAHINRFTITESEKVNHCKKMEIIANPDHDSLIETPNPMFVLCGGKTVTKKKGYDDNPIMHCELVGSDILNRATDTCKSQIKEMAGDTYDSSGVSGIRILQFSPPKRKTWKTSPKLCFGSQTRFKVSTKRRSSNIKTNKSVNKGVTVTREITNKKSSPKDSSSSQSISELKLSVQKRRLEKSIQLYDPDKFISNLMKPGLHSNPFIHCEVYCDLEWIELQETDLIKWLNTLLSPPDELATDKECQRVDVAELWHQVRKRNNVKWAIFHKQAPLMYHTNNRLSTLRKASCALFQTDYVANVFCKLVQHIDKQLITLKEDRNFFQDVGSQHKMLGLFLCYNPLWLRIGLETVYGRTVPLESNSDVVGLVSFIMHNFFEDKYLRQRFPNNNDEYIKNMTKLALKKFLMLVYFLDQAKTRKLIGLNPCLFTKNACYKASRDILLAFSREFIFGVGDFTKHLKTLGFVVSHEQMYLDEFDFSVRNLLDLRDGIRLCKVMEVILNDGTILNKLRTPAISKSQKIHNVSIALTALESAGFIITGDITPKDIVNGHREKMLSLLWQIKYKFQGPKYFAAAIKLQKWWRSLLWKKRFNDSVILKRQLRAAVTIQNRIRANNKMRKERSQYVHLKGTVIKIQRWYRACHIMKTYRKQYIVMRTAALKIQIWYRATILMCHQRAIFNRYKCSAILIQTWIRAIFQERLLMKKQNENIAATLIQRKFLSWKQQKYFRSLKNAVVLLQRKFREIRKQRHQAEEIQQEVQAALCIQRWYRRSKSEYLKKVRRISAAILIQRKYRAYREMRVERTKFNSIRAAAIVIQRRFKDKMLREREILIMQQKVNAAIKIQAIWRGYSVRKLKSKQLKCLSKNIKRVRENRVPKTIRNIYTTALHSLLTKVDIKEDKVMLIISNLTEVSRELCSDFALDGHLWKIFSYLKSCNTSMRSKNLCMISTRILVNVVRDRRNRFHVLQVESSLNIILLVMSKFFTIDNEIFCNCCKILWFLAEDNATTQMIREVPDCQRRLVSFHQQKAKKHKVVGHSSFTTGCMKRGTIPNVITWKEPLQAIATLLHKLNIRVPST